MADKQEPEQAQQLEEDEVVEISGSEPAQKSHSAGSKHSSSSKNQEAEVIGSPSPEKELVDMAFSPLDKKLSAQSQEPHERSFEQIVVMDSPMKSPEKNELVQQPNVVSQANETEVYLTPEKPQIATMKQTKDEILQIQGTQNNEKTQEKEQQNSQNDIQPPSPVPNPKQTMVSDSTRAASDKYYLPIQDKNNEQQPLVDSNAQGLNASGVNPDDQQSILLSESGSEKRRRLLLSGVTNRVEEQPLIQSRRCYCYLF